ncbi:MAG: thermonuclease family protein [Oscillospiraceae bacterium]|nr:thermonuclease family protein [Oscillospiraceae bacterium]
MKKRIFALLAALCIALGCLAGCSGNEEPVVETQGSGTQQAEWVDYAASIPLDMSSETAKQEVTVKAFVDGDTTHFNVPGSVSSGGLLKARYLAVNTPESTGKIEVWGKKASNFTKSRLESADSIYIESDDANWNVDSTGGRHLVWVWYRPAGSDTYRNLNIELLQEGLSIASSAADNRYGETCMAALTQAKAYNLHMHSKDKDPDFYYGDAIPVTLKELRTNIELYQNMKVAFEGVITYESGQTVYAEEYDPETDTYYGMTVYYGYNMTGTGLEILEPGNRLSFVGSVQYYATGGTWQISDIKYVDMRPNDPNNIQLISSGHEAANRLTDGKTFKTGKVEVDVRSELGSDETTTETRDYGQMVLSTSISMENLRVESISTTTNEDSSNKGAMTLTCRTSDGYVVSVRTAVLYDENSQIITADAYQGKTINVKGIVDYYTYSGYQVKVFSPDDITIVK